MTSITYYENIKKADARIVFAIMDNFDDICKDVITQEYFEELLKNKLLVCTYENNLVSFLIFSKKKNYYFVHLICSKKSGTGSLLMSYLEKEAIKNGTHEIRLNAVESALGFYEKMNFQTCGTNKEKEYICYKKLDNDQKNKKKEIKKSMKKIINSKVSKKVSKISRKLRKR